MNQLNWQPSDSGERAGANGFIYLVKKSRNEFVLYCDWCSDPVKQDSFSDRCMVASGLKIIAQSHADAVSRAISSKASTIDVEAIEESAMELYERELKRLAEAGQVRSKKAIWKEVVAHILANDPEVSGLKALLRMARSHIEDDNRDGEFKKLRSQIDAALQNKTETE